MFEVIDVTINDGVAESQYINITDKKYVAQPDFTELVTTKFTLAHTKTRKIFNVTILELLYQGRITLFQAAGRNVNAGCGEFIFKSI